LPPETATPNGGVPSVTDPEYRRGKRPPNYGKRYPPEPLTADEIKRLLDALPRTGNLAVRNRALIIALWRGGLRISEALALFPKDVDPEWGTITVLRGKGARRRTIGLDRRAMAELHRWLELRTQLGIGEDSPIFCCVLPAQRGLPMRPNNFNNYLKRLARKAGVRKRVHPHGFRHTHAFELAMEGVPVHLIQAQLGHNSLSTTDRYVRHLAPLQLVKAMQAREWPAAAAPQIPVAAGLEAAVRDALHQAAVARLAG
jgi:site-specific recombinase XerD